jgi:hypothetical protein
MRRAIVAAMTVLCVIVAGFIGSYVALAVGFARHVRRAQAALISEGRPMTAQTIIPRPVAETENAAPLYRAAVMRLRATKADQGDLCSALSEAAAGSLAAASATGTATSLRVLLAQKATLEALAEIEEGTARPSCRYDIDYSKGAGILLPHLAELRTLSRILTARARVQAEDGDPAGAWRTAGAGLRLANALETEPLLISQLVRIAQAQQAMETVRRLCSHALPPLGDLAALDSLLKQFEDGRPFSASMDGERLLFGDWAFRSLPRSELRKTSIVGDAGGAKAWLVLASLFTPLLQRDYAAYLEVMHTYARNAAEPYSPDDANRGERLLAQVPPYCVLTRLLAPALSSAKIRHLEAVAQARVTRAGLGVLRHWREHRAYPATLAECGRANDVDPFTSRPLLYRANTDRAVVYSTGADGKDNGGEGTPPAGGKAADIAWTCVGPASDTGRER